MPRIKQPPTVPTSSLDGFSLAFCAVKKTNIPLHHNDLANKTFTELEGEIEEAGGSVVTKIEPGKCTHLLATSEQYEKQGARIRDAIKSNIPILSYDWLAASLLSQDAVDENTFSLHQAATSSPTPAATNGTTIVATKATGTSNKRPREDDDDAKSDVKKVKSEADEKKVVGNGAVVSKSKVKVPIDTEYPSPWSVVHEDEDSVFLDATLNQTQSGVNANKFYRLQLLKHSNDSYFTWTRWGRVGDKGQSKVLGDGSLAAATKEFQKKFKDKSGLHWANRDNPPVPGEYDHPK
jgi:poly [ADP-ribose] polymerase 2/3/4